MTGSQSKSRRRSWRRVAGVLFALAVTSCSLFVDLSGLNGGSPSDTAPAADANDAKSSDEASVNDAAFDGPFCEGLSPKPVFCADFDETEDGGYGTEWTRNERSADGSATLVLDDVEARSMPHALHGKTLGGFDGNNLSVDLPAFTTSMTADVDFYFEKQPTAGSTAVIAFSTNQTPANRYLLLYISATSSYLQEGDDTGASSPFTPFPFTADNLWHHASITVALAPSSSASRVTAVVDGTEVLSSWPMNYPWSGFSKLTLFTGLVDVYQASAVEVSVDNVVFTSN